MSVSVSLSVTSQCSVEMDGQIELVFSLVVSLDLSYTLYCKEIQLQNEDTFLWNVVLNTNLGKFRPGISIVEIYYHLSSTNMDAQSVINWTVVGD